jgi:hypothetical protein
MRTWILPILVCAGLGLLAGLTLFRVQTSSARSMNELGVVACASLGLSMGCLLAESPIERRRRR